MPISPKFDEMVEKAAAGAEKAAKVKADDIPAKAAAKAPKKGKQRQRGGQALYRPEFDGIARRLTSAGSTYSQIADILGVSDVTLWRWQCAHQTFREALRLGSEVANDRVEKSLFDQAVGFYYDAEEIKVVDKGIVRVKVRKFFEPSASAAIFWAKAKMGLRDGGNEIEGTAPIDETTQSMRDLARRAALVLLKGGKLEDVA